MIAYVLLAAWTYLVVRALGARGTLRDRTLATYGLAGCLMGTVAAPVVERLVLPYPFDVAAPRAIALQLVRLSVILAPVVIILLARRAHRALGVADAFLLAFMVGFGFDVICGLVSLAFRGDVGARLALFPPFEAKGPVIAGYGYSAALVTLALATMLRFARHRGAALAVAAVVLVCVAVDQAPAAGPGAVWLGWITAHGTVTAWLALAALVVASIVEWRWLGAYGRGAGVTDEWRPRMSALARGAFEEFTRLGRLYGLRRQLALVGREVAEAPADRSSRALLERLRAHAAYLERSASEPARAAESAAPLPLWRRPSMVQTAGWIAVLVFLYVPALRLLLLLATPVLVAVLLWRAVTAPVGPGPRSDVDDAVQFWGERTILRAGVGLAFVLFLGVPASTGPPASTVGPFHSLLFAWVPKPFAPWELGALLPLVAVAASGVTLHRARLWAATPGVDWRAAVLRNVLRVGSAFLLVWGCFTIYRPVVEWSHFWFGRSVQGFFQWKPVQSVLWMNPQDSGPFTAYTIGIVVALLVGAAVAALFGLLRRTWRGLDAVPPARRTPSTVAR
ncbi:MAG TPA: hypothetical protein VGT02_11365 [Methylomirabilota bacterium]|jgi:hypothetical protein|nr:hypothetical protein [Methylomirabilota bacterium]